MIIFSWQMAEELAAAHMRQLGFEQVRRMPDGVDRGLDVTARDAAAQVKHHAVAVGSPDVQRLRGAAPHVETLLFYSSSGYTQAAKDAADLAHISLFGYTTSNEISAENGLAERLMQRSGGDALAVAIFESMKAGARSTVLGHWVNRMVQRDGTKALKVGSREVVPDLNEINRLLTFARSMPAIVTAMEDLTRVTVDPARVEAISTSDVAGINASTDKVRQATESLLSLVTIDVKGARALNAALQRKYDSENYTTFREAGQSLELFVATTSA